MNGSADTFGKNSPDEEKNPISNDSRGNPEQAEVSLFMKIVRTISFGILGKRKGDTSTEQETSSIDDPHSFGISLSNPTDKGFPIKEGQARDTKEFDPDLPANKLDAPHGEQEE